jgi:hypothetical protein
LVLVKFQTSGDGRQPPTPLVHGIRGPLPDLQDISPLPEFGFQIGIFCRGCRSAFGNATVVIGGAVLTYVLKTGTKNAVIVGRKFREESKDDALLVHSEYDDGGFGGFHWSILSTEMTSAGSAKVAALALDGAAAFRQGSWGKLLPAPSARATFGPQPPQQASGRSLAILPDRQMAVDKVLNHPEELVDDLLAANRPPSRQAVLEGCTGIGLGVLDSLNILAEWNLLAVR